VITLREFRARSVYFGQNGGWDESCEVRVFLCGNPTTFRQLCNGQFSPNLVTKRNSVCRHGIRKELLKNFCFRGHLPPKSVIESHQTNRHLTQSRLQVTRYTAEISRSNKQAPHSEQATGHGSTSLRASYRSRDTLQR